MSRMVRFFDLERRGTTVGRELRGAVATFLTMAYILFVNPDILFPKERHADLHASAVACTAAAAGICCILMGVVANFPIALASGMGLNAVVAGMWLRHDVPSWQVAMGLVVLDGLVVALLVLVGLREAVLRAIPRDLRRAIGAGIGLFIALIGLVSARIVVTTGAGPPAPPITFGSLHNPDTAVALVGLVLTTFLLVRRVTGALLVGILLTTGIALAWDLAGGGDTFTRAWPRELRGPSFDVAFQADVVSAFSLAFLPLLLSLLMVDFFDTLGTVTAIAEQGGLQDEQGNTPGLRNILLVDAAGASIGGAFGVSSVTSYIESAAGVAEGARTGLHSVFVGLFFLAAIILAPVAGIVPAAATAPALMLVGFLMCGPIARIDFEQLDTAIPAFIILITVPFTYSIAHGIGYGFIAYVAIQVLSGRSRAVHPLMYGTAVLFLVYFIAGS